MFTAELWQFFGVVVIPLIGLLISGIVYWVRKLDDSQYQAAMNSVSKADLTEGLRLIHERLIRIENAMQGRTTPGSMTPPSRWRTL